MPFASRSSASRLYLAYAAIGVLDLARVLWPPPPQPADEVEPSWLYRRARVVGLPHTETAQAYQIETYWTTGGVPFGKPTKVAPFVLLPLNVPDRSGGRMVLLEYPLEPGAPELDVEGVEFTGLLGPVPDDLLPFIKRPTLDSRPMRLQPAELPSAAFSLLLLAGTAWVLRTLRKIERRELESTAMSKLVFFIAQIPLLILLAARLRFHPAANHAGTWALTAVVHGAFFAFAWMMMREPRPEDAAGAPLADEAFAAASAAHEELRSRDLTARR